LAWNNNRYFFLHRGCCQCQLSGNQHSLKYLVLCSKKQTHSGLEQLEGDYVMTFLFLVEDYLLKIREKMSKLMSLYELRMGRNMFQIKRIVYVFEFIV